jgi:hypothetical protein
MAAKDMTVHFNKGEDVKKFTKENIKDITMVTEIAVNSGLDKLMKSDANAYDVEKYADVLKTLGSELITVIEKVRHEERIRCWEVLKKAFEKNMNVEDTLASIKEEN